MENKEKKKVKFFEVTKEKIENIKLDAFNPNEMSKIQMEGLKEVMNKFGFLEPIIVNKDNMVIDGEHRFNVLKEMGEKEIPVIRLNVNELDRKIIRQTMNKLRGRHNPRDDIEDLLEISKQVSMNDMSKYLGLSEKNLGDYLESVNQVPESFLMLMMEEKNKLNNKKFITLKLTDDQARKLIGDMGDLELKEIALVPVNGILVDNKGRSAD